MSKVDTWLAFLGVMWLWVTWPYWFSAPPKEREVKRQIVLSTKELNAIVNQWNSLPVGVSVCALKLKHHRYRIDVDQPQRMSQWLLHHPHWKMEVCDQN